MIIPLTKGLSAIVDDDCPHEIVGRKWCAHSSNGKWYAKRGVKVAGKSKAVLMHREIIGAQLGQDVDHINGDSLDNRLCNLRVANRSQNIANQGVPKNSTSGFKGVAWHKQKNRWRAYIVKDGRQKHLGLFADAAEAAKAYDAAALAVFGEFACLNFPR